MSRFFLCGQTRREYLLSDFHQTRVAKTYWARQEQHEQFICWKPGNWDVLDTNSVQRGTSVSHLYWNGLFKFLLLQFGSCGVDVLCMIQATQCNRTTGIKWELKDFTG